MLGEATGLTGFWVIFAIVVFGGTIGFVGLIIGVPAFAVIYTWIKTGLHADCRKSICLQKPLLIACRAVFKMTEEEKIVVDKMESEQAEEAFRKATKQTFPQKIKNGGKIGNTNSRKAGYKPVFYFINIRVTFEPIGWYNNKNNQFYFRKEGDDF